MLQHLALFDIMMPCLFQCRIVTVGDADDSAMSTTITNRGALLLQGLPPAGRQWPMPAPSAASAAGASLAGQALAAAGPGLAAAKLAHASAGARWLGHGQPRHVQWRRQRPLGGLWRLRQRWAIVATSSGALHHSSVAERRDATSELRTTYHNIIVKVHCA